MTLQEENADNILKQYIFLLLFRMGVIEKIGLPYFAEIVLKSNNISILLIEKNSFAEKDVIKISINVVSFYACPRDLRRFFIFYNPIIIGLFRYFLRASGVMIILIHGGEYHGVDPSL